MKSVLNIYKRIKWTKLNKFAIERQAWKIILKHWLNLEKYDKFDIKRKTHLIWRCSGSNKGTLGTFARYKTLKFLS